MIGPPALPTGVVVEAREQGALYRLLRVRRVNEAATRGMLLAHALPGQFVRVETAGEQTYFALADAPDPAGDALELLIKRGGAVADALFGLVPGDRLAMSDPEGDGFPIDLACGLDLVLVAAGSGIAAIRAVLAAVAKRRNEFGRIALYYGQARAEDFAFASEFLTRRSAALTVTLCASAAAADWSGARGRVQSALSADAPKWNPTRTAVFVCGMAAMEDEVQALMEAHGVSASRIFTNA